MAFVSLGSKSGRVAYKYAAMLIHEGFDVLVCVNAKGKKRFDIFVGNSPRLAEARRIMAMTKSQRYLLTTK